MDNKKVILVSGASGNLGRAVVNYFIARDCMVIGLVRHKKKPSYSEQYYEYEVDLLEEKEVEHCVTKIISEHSTIHAAILTAGGFKIGNIRHTRIAELEQQIQLNFQTAYNLARPLLDQFEKQNYGQLFFIGSLPALHLKKAVSTVAYSLSKSLLLGLNTIINEQFKTISTVKSFVVVPSTIDTPQNRKAVPDADFDKWEKPEMIAKLIDELILSDKQADASVVVVKDYTKQED